MGRSSQLPGDWACLERHRPRAHRRQQHQALPTATSHRRIISPRPVGGTVVCPSSGDGQLTPASGSGRIAGGRVERAKPDRERPSPHVSNFIGTNCPSSIINFRPRAVIPQKTRRDKSIRRSGPSILLPLQLASIRSLLYMAETGKRPMPDNASSQASKKRKGGASKWKQQSKNSIETGDCGVFITCDIGKEGKCIPEAIDLFSQRVEEPANAGEKEDSSADEDEDIEAQIRKEVEGMKPGSGSKPPLFRPVRLDITCVSFIRFDKSLDPEKMVHDICVDAYNNPDRKQTRFLQRMTPVRSIRKTLSVDLEVFAKEILKPHFHSGGPPKKYAIRPNVKGGSKLKRDEIIQTVARCVGPGHSVDLKNYDLIILVDVVQNVIGMSVAGSDYEKLKRYNLAELYKPSAKPEPSKTTELKDEGPAAS